MAPYSDATHLNGSCTPTPVVPGTHTFTFTCNGPGGSMSQSVTHYVVSSQTASVLDAFNGAANSGASQTAVSGAGFSYAWDRDLQIGSPFFADVSALQTALTKEGVYTGDVTGGFYNQTFTAVKAFQQKYDIRVTGYVGSITRAKLNTLY
jgi:hypothetical protein